MIIKTVISSLCILIGITAFPGEIEIKQWTREEIWGIDKLLIKESLGPEIFKNRYPSNIKIMRGSEEIPATINYTIDLNLQNHVKNIFKKFNPDYGIFVALDADNGEILAMVNHKRGKINTENLALRATYPAASVFKVVTAAAALDLKKLESNTIIPFNGKSTTLYRKNVFQHENNKWTNRYTLSQAFAKSVNTIFARIGVFLIGQEKLGYYAENFGFNRDLGSDFLLEESHFELIPEDDWSTAESSSGYTRATTISPVHGAVIGAIAINEGSIVEPNIVRSIKNSDGLTIYEANRAMQKKVIDISTAKQLQLMMRNTITNGSAKNSFKNFFSSKFKNIHVGGKTGSLSGANPSGRYDWFIGFAELNGRKISFAAMCINREFWYVKSAFVARSAIENFFVSENILENSLN